MIKTSAVLPLSGANVTQGAHTAPPDSSKEQSSCLIFFLKCYHLYVIDKVTYTGCRHVPASLEDPWGTFSTPGLNYLQDQVPCPKERQTWGTFISFKDKDNSGQREGTDVSEDNYGSPNGVLEQESCSKREWKSNQGLFPETSAGQQDTRSWGQLLGYEPRWPW